MHLAEATETLTVAPNGAAGQVNPAEAAAASHAERTEREALFRRFGFDAEASVRFVLDKALPLRGRVLDIGTGKGRFVVLLARHAANVVTVDIDVAEQYHAVQEAHRSGVAGRIRFVTHDARFLPWAAGSFDVVTSWNVIHHLSDPDRVLSEAMRVVKPGGRLVLADFSPEGFRLMDAIHAAEGRRHPHPPTRFAAWHARLRSTGFLVRRFRGHHEELLLARRPPAKS